MKNTYKTLPLALLAFNLCLSFVSFSQIVPSIHWQNTIGGNADDLLFSVHQTTDWGYIFGGFSRSDISGDKTENSIGGFDYWMVKTDSLGNIQWQNTIGGSDEDGLYSIQQSVDGGYILGGISSSNISGDKTENCLGQRDYWVVKTDSLGTIQWQNTIGGSDWDDLTYTRQTADGGYILGGSSLSNISGDKTENCIGNYDYWIVKTDSLGNIQWQNTIGGNDEDYFFSMQQTADGGYIIGGYSESNISGDKTENCIGDLDYWMVKTDSAGNIQWQNTIGGSGLEELLSIQQTADGGYILGGYSFSGISGDKTENSWNNSGDYWVLKTDAAGNIQWQNTIGGNMNDILCSVQQTTDGGYILDGYSSSNISGDKTENSIGGLDYWVVKTDSLGNIQWQNTIGGNSDEFPYSTQQTTDGGYIIGGYSWSNISGDKTENCMGAADYWIVKLNPDTITSIPAFQSSIFNLQLSPNPVTNELNVKTNKNEFLEIFLFDITSRKIMQQQFTNSVSINTEQLAKGLYLYEVRDKNGLCKKGKVVKQ